MRGAVAMGIGEVLLEEHTYAEDGQLLTASLRHYLPPLAADVPPVEIHHLESPTPARHWAAKASAKPARSAPSGRSRTPSRTR